MRQLFLILTLFIGIINLTTSWIKLLVNMMLIRENIYCIFIKGNYKKTIKNSCIVNIIIQILKLSKDGIYNIRLLFSYSNKLFKY